MVLGIGTAFGQSGGSIPPLPGSHVTTTDHNKLQALKGPFKSAAEVTRACLSCHTEAATQIHGTVHWTWEFNRSGDEKTLGMRHVLNNLFIGTASNEENCTQCHVGNGWTDATFDFAAQDAVDCLACHDTTGDYTFQKFHPGTGDCVACHDETPRFEKKRGRSSRRTDPDFAKLARSVGLPKRDNCGSCHFLADSGDGAKHGDLDSTLLNAPRTVDVHMSPDGLDFSCTTCHTTGGHVVSGSRYALTAKDPTGIDVPGHTDNSRASCESCHGWTPHSGKDHAKLNDHTDRIACATCHIPEIARGDRKTLVSWDWSVAGEREKKREDLIRRDDEGYPTYHTKKGALEWAANLLPTYRWFNGRMDYMVVGDMVGESRPVDLNPLSGGPDDPDARIWPFKIIRGRQPFDAANKTLIVPHWGERDRNAYWAYFDWKRAAAAGMEAAGLPFSGTVDFVDTRFQIPIQHMVAPKAQAVPCNDCHTKGGRLEELKGFYMPGRDSLPFLSLAGWGGALMTLIAVVLHGIVRIVLPIISRSRRR